MCLPWSARSIRAPDMAVVHLLRRGLEGLNGKLITVVTGGHNDAMRQRYTSLFGQEIDWQPIGFLAWLGKRGPQLVAKSSRSIHGRREGLPAQLERGDSL